MTIEVYVGALTGWESHADRLDPRESARSGRLPAGDVRRRYVASRAVLRHVLGRHLGTEPERVEFARTSCAHCGSTKHGKPRLAAGPVEFNLSHSGELIAIAVGTGVAVGIDIEASVPQDPAGIARRFFSQDEQAADISPQDFLRLWTRKEAALKVGGRGLAGSLEFSVSDDLVRLPDDTVVSVRDVPAPAPCAVAVDGTDVAFSLVVHPVGLPARAH